MRALLDTLGTSLVIGASSRFDELDLGVNEKRAEVDAIDLAQEIRYLPDLPTVHNDWLAQDLEKIDDRNRQVLTTFYEQAFVPYFRENRLIIQELASVYQGVLNGLHKDWEQYEDRFRRRKALQKAINDLYFQARSLLDSVRDEHLEVQRAALEKALLGTLSDLEADVRRFPTELRYLFARRTASPSLVILLRLGGLSFAIASGMVYPASASTRGTLPADCIVLPARQSLRFSGSDAARMGRPEPAVLYRDTYLSNTSGSAVDVLGEESGAGDRRCPTLAEGRKTASG